jgi:hypothetical protein
MKKQVIFRGEPIDLTFFLYNDRKTGILMVHAGDNQFWGNATLNMESTIKKNEIIVKSYGDANKGLYEVLLENEIVKPFRRMLQVGLNSAHICELGDKIVAELKL